jgi:SAM-dependent methyltransferase
MLQKDLCAEWEATGQEAKRQVHYSAVGVHYDHLASERSAWIEHNRYFYKRDLKNLQALIPSGPRLLEVGCGNGDLLNKLKPSYGVGLDVSADMVELVVIGNVEDEDWIDSVGGPFDYILLADVIGHPTQPTPETRQHSRRGPFALPFARQARWSAPSIPFQRVSVQGTRPA